MSCSPSPCPEPVELVGTPTTLTIMDNPLVPSAPAPATKSGEPTSNEETNASWGWHGLSPAPAPAPQCRFERFLESLAVPESVAADHPAVREWALRNAADRFVPETLLNRLGLRIDWGKDLEVRVVDLRKLRARDGRLTDFSAKCAAGDHSECAALYCRCRCHVDGLA